MTFEVPEGYVLLPKEPTEAMLNVALNLHPNARSAKGVKDTLAEKYRKMWKYYVDNP